MSKNYFKVHYRGSMAWLILWIIIFFPVALTLFFTAVTFKTKQTTSIIRYEGSRFWLCFWMVIFFPIAFVLLFLNGFSVKTISH